MKTAEERVQFKNHFFKLAQGRLIPPGDTRFWRVFWTWPETAADIFDLFTAYDISTVRDQNLANFLVLVHVLLLRLVLLSRRAGTSSEAVQPARASTGPTTQLARAVTPQRVAPVAQFLAKLLPFVFELPSYPEIEALLFLRADFSAQDLLALHTLHSSRVPMIPVNFTTFDTPSQPASPRTLPVGVFEERWASRLTDPGASVRDTGPGAGPSTGPVSTTTGPGSGTGPWSSAEEPLAVSLVTACVALLFTPGLGLQRDHPKTPRGLPLWEPGLGCPAPYTAPDPATDACRLDLVRLLLVLQLRAFYLPPQTVVEHGLVFSLVLVAALPRAHLLSLVCSLANVVCRQGRPGAETGYSGAPLAALHMRTAFLVLAAQLLATMVLYVMPGERHTAFLPARANTARLFFARLALDADLAFLAAHLVTPAPVCAQAAQVFFWELCQCNMRFRLLVMDKHAVRLLPHVLDALLLHDKPLWAHRARTLAYFLLYLLSQAAFARPLLADARAPSRDFVVVQTCLVLAALARRPPLRVRHFLLATLLEVLYNIVPLPHTDDAPWPAPEPRPSPDLSPKACSALALAVLAFTNRAFLAEPHHTALLALLVRAIAAAVAKHQPPNLMASLLEHDDLYSSIAGTLRSLDVPAAIPEADEAELPPGLPNGSADGSFYRHDPGSGDSLPAPPSLDDWLRPRAPAGMSEMARGKLPLGTPLSTSWGGADALRVLLLTVAVLRGDLRLSRVNSRRSAEAARPAGPDPDVRQRVLDALLALRPALHYDLAPATPVHLLQFVWSPQSLGWYMSMIYYDVYSAGDIVKDHVSSKNILLSSLAALTKFALWPLLAEPDAASEMIEATLFSTNLWAATSTKLFEERDVERGYFARLGSMALTSSDLTTSLVKRFGDLRTRTSVLSGSVYADDENGLAKRGSVSSLRSLNTLNLARWNLNG